MNNGQNQIPNITPDPVETGQPAIQQVVAKPNSSKNLIIGLVIAVVVMTVISVGSVALLLSRTVLSPIRQDNALSVGNSTEKVVKLKEVCATYEKICVDVPEDWQVDVQDSTYPERGSDMANEMDESELVDIDKVILTSPDGEQTVGLSSGITGVGGRCDTSSGSQVYVIKEKQTDLTGYLDESRGYLNQAYAVSIITTNEDNSEFTPAIILTSSSSLIGKTQEQYCASAFADLVTGRNVGFPGGNISYYGNVSLSTTPRYINNADLGDSTYNSLNEAKQALNSQNFQQAFNIIASARY